MVSEKKRHSNLKDLVDLLNGFREMKQIHLLSFSNAKIHTLHRTEALQKVDL